MCAFSIDERALFEEFPDQAQEIRSAVLALQGAYPDLFEPMGDLLELRDFAKPLVRVIAQRIDQFAKEGMGYSTAI